MEVSLKISNLDFKFPLRKQTDHALYLFKDFNLQVQKGITTSIVGGNGAGKTTLFNIISGIERPLAGEIYFNGKQISGKSPDRIAREGIGRLFQGAKVYDELTILENMLLGETGRRYERPFINIVRRQKYLQSEKMLTEKACDILQRLFGQGNEYWDGRNKAAGSLSYGQQRLLALARLLMGEYSLYLLDEPTAGVNIRYIETITEMLHLIKNDFQKTVLVIEHNIQFVRDTADCCIFIDNAKVIAEGGVAEVFNNKMVQQSYIGG